MVYRPFRSFGRLGLAACAVSLGVASLSAQSAPSTPAPVGPNPSRIDIFTGFSYFGAHGQVKPADINYKSINLGAAGSGAYFFNKYIGAEIQIQAHPGHGDAAVNTTQSDNDGLFSYAGGLIARAPMQNYTLFGHGLVGGAYLGGPNSEVLTTLEHEPYQWGPTIIVGGGLDYDLPFLNHKFSLRLFEADYQYVHADYGPSTTIPTGGVLGGRANLSGVDLSTGIVTHFGHIIPPPPVTYSCAVSPATAYPGDPITVTGTALNLNPKKTATYTWNSTGGVITGTSSTANIATATAAPGTYTVKGHVSEGSKPGEMADCSVDFTVKDFDPPTISCSASPSSVNAGDSSTITSVANSPQNRPLTYSYTSSAGNVSGTSSTATLSTVGAPGGTITVTCNVADDKGHTASTTTSVMVNTPTPPPVVKSTQPLCTLHFDRTNQPPTRVDNEAKACLDDLALALQRSTDATLYEVGNSAPIEAKRHSKMDPAAEANHRAAERAVNAKNYLVTEKGIDPSRIKVETGTAGDNTVADILVPAGADATTIQGTPVDESAIKPIPRKPLGSSMARHHGKRHHHHKSTK